MKTKFLLTVAIAAIAAGVITWTIQNKTDIKPNFKELWLEQAELKVEIVDTPKNRAAGLGGRKSLPQDQGMFFVFEQSDVYPFWMKDMRFPLDIIWMDSDYKVVDLIQDVKPDSYPNSIVPEKSALYVLETNSGWIKENNIKIGSQAFLK